MKIIGYTEAGHYRKKYLVEMTDAELGRVTGIESMPAVHAQAVTGAMFPVDALASKVEGIRRVHSDAVNCARRIRELADVLERNIPEFAKPKEGE